MGGAGGLFLNRPNLTRPALHTTPFVMVFIIEYVSGPVWVKYVSGPVRVI